jgi:hypothetical protein
MKRLLLLLTVVVVGSRANWLTLDEALARATDKTRIQQARPRWNKLPVSAFSVPSRDHRVGQRARGVQEASGLDKHRAVFALRALRHHSFTRQFRPPCGAEKSKCWSLHRS